MKYFSQFHLVADLLSAYHIHAQVFSWTGGNDSLVFILICLSFQLCFTVVFNDKERYFSHGLTDKYGTQKDHRFTNLLKENAFSKS
jgi:3'-phosphoadenosine 5'-phosphosulfate sulfotransferase (PAPS reductase)/FAD synthetase